MFGIKLPVCGLCLNCCKTVWNIVEDEPGGPFPLECSFYKHYIWVTLKEDINLDFKVDLKDYYAICKKYGKL